jgi:hypothetical protein
LFPPSASHGFDVAWLCLADLVWLPYPSLPANASLPSGSSTVLKQEVGVERLWWQTLLQNWVGGLVQGWIG